MTELRYRKFALIAALVCALCALKQQSPAQIVAKIYHYELPRQLLDESVKARQLFSGQSTDTYAQKVRSDAAIQFFREKVEIVEARKRGITASEQEVEADLQKQIERAREVITDDDIKGLRNLMLAEASSFEDYNALPDKSDAQARTIYDKYAPELKKYSKEDMSFQRWKLDVMSFAHNLDEYRASIPSSLEDSVRRGAAEVRQTIVAAKLQDQITRGYLINAS
jgi:hypothetical protein